jgi:hypothetical protein
MGLPSLFAGRKVSMSRVAQIFSSNLVIVPVAAVLIAFGAGGLWYTNHQAHVQTTVNAQHQLTQISYNGRSGTTALALLKEHASVKTKHYSFGDLVLSIDGVAGNGPKYWTFYVNHKQANVGAGAYVTKNSDVISWKLQ